MSGIELGIKKLRELAQDPDYRTFLENFAARDRDRRVTTVDWMTNKFGVSRAIVVAFFKELAAIELGRFVSGRRGQQSRFEWLTRMTEVGMAAIGESEEIESITEEVVDEFDEASDEGDESVITHSFVLRRGHEEIKVSLPADLTEKEAERLAAFIKTLPME